MKKKVLFTVIIAIMLLFCVKGFATTRIIPTNYSTIQLAINASVNGDIVLVLAGTYYENINFNGKNITVASNYINDGLESTIEGTIIDGNNLNPVVTFNNNETLDAKLIGLTIQHGKQVVSANRGGGGVCCDDSSPTIEHCRIIHNSSPVGIGGGIKMWNSCGIIRYCLIEQNQASHGGGGITFASVTIQA